MEPLGANPQHDGPRSWPPGWHVSVVEETGSTNADLLAKVGHGALDRTVLAARHQTAGRGRLDRRWDAPPGANLLVSLLFTDVPDVPHVLTQRVGVAAAIACERVAGARPVLKWPNDLLITNQKLAGVLAQVAFHEGKQAVVVGIGINVGWAPPEATRLGDGIDPLDLLHAMLVAYDELPADIAEEYRGRLGTLGRLVRVELPDDGVLTGRALDVEPDGQLVVLDECGITHRIGVGDVVHLRARDL